MTGGVAWNPTTTNRAPILREYQREAAGAVMAAWSNGINRPAIVLATGLGKTVVFADLARIQSRALGRRPLVLVHRDELVRQSVAKLREADPTLRVGIIQGRDLGIARTDIVVASVQTLIRRLAVIDPARFDLIICDECHHVSANSYRAILEHFGAFNGGAISLGVTATMSRGDNKGLGEIWEKVVFERDIRFGVEGGFLVPAEVRTVRVAGLDTDRVRTGADGDLAPGALARAMSQAHAGPLVARAYSEFARDGEGRLRRGIVFAATVETAEAWCRDFWHAGVRAAVITGATPTEVRQGAYADLAAGRIDAIVSVLVLTEGFDLPAVEVAVIGRPTKSMALLTQMVGRVLRPSPVTGKSAALVIDVVGAMGAGLARTIDLSIPEPTESIAPTEDDVGARDASLAPPVPELPIPGVDWIVMDLHGQMVAPAVRRKGSLAPEWLRTYGGAPFLAPTMEFPDLVFVGRDGAFWRLVRGAREPERLDVAPGADVRDMHPGIRRAPRMVAATDKQLALLRRLARPDGSPLAGDVRPSAADAGALLDVHFASKAID